MKYLKLFEATNQNKTQIFFGLKAYQMLGAQLESFLKDIGVVVNSVNTNYEMDGFGIGHEGGGYVVRVKIVYKLDGMSGKEGEIVLRQHGGTGVRVEILGKGDDVSFDNSNDIMEHINKKIEEIGDKFKLVN